jgi:hypothetical protein
MSLRAFVITEEILRQPERFLLEINHGIAIREKMRAMLISSVVFFALFGALLGSTHSLWQTISSAIKLPLLFLITLLICAPALYIFSQLFNLRLQLSQSISLVLVAIAATSIVLVSFSSIVLFFVMTAPGLYQFFKLLNVVCFIIAAGVGASYLSRGMRLALTTRSGAAKPQRLVFYLWLAFYFLVGSQMAWTLRPFVGYPNAPFEPFRQVGGNFYDNIFASIGEILGFLIVR